MCLQHWIYPTDNQYKWKEALIRSHPTLNAFDCWHEAFEVGGCSGVDHESCQQHKWIANASGDINIHEYDLLQPKCVNYCCYAITIRSQWTIEVKGGINCTFDWRCYSTFCTCSTSGNANRNGKLSCKLDCLTFLWFMSCQVKNLFTLWIAIH